MKRIFTVIILLSAIAASALAQRRGGTDYAAQATEAKAAAIKSLNSYNLDAASDQLDRWETALDKLKKPYPQELSDVRDRVIMARNMLERVEKIEIVDTLHVDSVAFFANYRLSPDAGSLVDSSILPDEYASAHPRLVYMPQDEKELFWGMPGDDGRVRLVVADVLDDGTVDTPRLLGDMLGSADTDYPFMLDDGVTIYYGSNGEGSLGGYDIFMTRRNPDGRLFQPQNVGMPYNSPFNDYLLAIDDANGIGWWASDREQIPGKVTIYVFVPSKMRVNYDSTSEDIVKYALLKDVETTGDLDRRLTVLPEADDAEETFFFPIGDGRVYTTLAQFKSPQARQAMKNLLKRQLDLEVSNAQLAALRERYGAGDKSVASDILKLEKSQRDALAAIKRNTNQVINLEKK